MSQRPLFTLLVLRGNLGNLPPHTNLSLSAGVLQTAVLSVEGRRPFFYLFEQEVHHCKSLKYFFVTERMKRMFISLQIMLMGSVLALRWMPAFPYLPPSSCVRVRVTTSSVRIGQEYQEELALHTAWNLHKEPYKIKRAYQDAKRYFFVTLQSKKKQPHLRPNWPLGRMTRCTLSKGTLLHISWESIISLAWKGKKDHHLEDKELLEKTNRKRCCSVYKRSES